MLTERKIHVKVDTVKEKTKWLLNLRGVYL